MAVKISKELKIGVFIVAVLSVSFLVVNFLKGKDIFNREYELISTYEDVQGLLPSCPVYVKGFKAGSVADVEYDSGSGKFVVTCSLLNDFLVPEDSRMTIYSVDIMGSKGVRIDFGSSAEYARDGDFLEPATAPDMIASITGSLGPLVEKAEKTMDNLDLTIENINKSLNEKNRAAFAGTLSHLERTVRNIESISSSIEGKSMEITSFIDNLNAVASSMTSVIDKADSAMADISGFASSLNRTDMEGTLASFKSLVDKIQDPDGSLGRLMNDASVYTSLDSLLNDVDRLIKKIEENPKKYIRISVF